MRAIISTIPVQNPPDNHDDDDGIAEFVTHDSQLLPGVQRDPIFPRRTVHLQRPFVDNVVLPPLSRKSQRSLGHEPHPQPPRSASPAHVHDHESGHDQVFPDLLWVGWVGRLDVVVEIRGADDGDRVRGGLEVEHPACGFGKRKEGERVGTCRRDDGRGDQVGRVDAGHGGGGGGLGGGACSGSCVE